MSFRLRRLALMLPLAAAVTLGACHDRESDRPDAGNEDTIVEPVAPENTAPTPEPVPETPVENVVAPPKPAPLPEISEDQQVLDDAAAVGMTARRSGTSSAGGGEESSPPHADDGSASGPQQPGQIY